MEPHHILGVFFLCIHFAGGIDVPPRIISTNFKSVELRSPGDRFEKGEALLGTSFHLTCLTAGGFVVWTQQNSSGHVKAVDCKLQGTNRLLGSDLIERQFPGAHSLKSQGLTNDTQVTLSSCIIVLKNYSYTGKYWCSVCNEGGNCIPSQPVPPKEHSQVRVIGPPQPANHYWTTSTLVEPAGDYNQVNVTIPFCSSGFQQVAWRIGNLSMRAFPQMRTASRLNRINVYDPRKLSSDCYSATLLILPLRQADLQKQIWLEVSNAFGRIKIYSPEHEFEEKILKEQKPNEGSEKDRSSEPQSQGAAISETTKTFVSVLEKLIKLIQKNT